jgi:hypothetical protein
MPTKNKVQKLKQKQRQSQNVKVIVNLGEKRKRKRKSKPRAKAQEKEAEVVGYKAFPPQIIYPSQPVVFSNFEAKPAPPVTLAQTVTERVRPPAGILEDIGNIGTEGVGVEILDKPTKKETLSELETPVGIKPSKIPVPLAQTLKEKLPSSLTEGLSSEGEFEIGAREVMQELGDVKETRKETVRGKPRPKDVVRKEKEDKYEKVFGERPRAELSNAQIEKEITKEKKERKYGKKNKNNNGF